MAELKPCPFCCGEAEMDTRQAYCALGTGRGGTRIAAYCRDCGADIGICREDVPGVEPDLVIEMWNRRIGIPEALALLDQAARLRDVGDIGARDLERRARGLLRGALGVAPTEAPSKGFAFAEWQKHPVFPHAKAMTHFDAGWQAAKAAYGVGVLRHQTESPADADDAGIGHE